MTRRVIVCGGRTYSDRKAVFSALDSLLCEHHALHIIEGGARGADALAGEWADERFQVHTRVPARWDLHGTAAGPVRNQAMLLFADQPNIVRPIVLAFPGGRGTADMVRRAMERGITVIQET